MSNVGVFVCDCGTNIAENIDVEEVVKFSSNIDDVAFVTDYKILCSEEGKENLRKDIKDKNLTHIVVAACSPKQYESTFMKVCSGAGINPYLFQLANIREMCAWVSSDKVMATKKAKALIKAAVKRVLLQEPLEKKEIEVNPDVLILGAGVAGMESALLTAKKGRKAYLVEKEPCIGGNSVKCEEVFPNLECAPCMLEPIMDKVIHNENIELFTYSNVEELLGFLGNFIMKIKKRARYINAEMCFGCGACFEVCPVNVPNKYNEYLDTRKAIYVPFPGALPNIPVIDKENCLHFKGKECKACVEACGFGAIDFNQEDEIIEKKVGGIVLATGFNLFDCTKAPQYGYKKYDNVHTSLEFERILSSTGPTNGEIKLKNGQKPKSIAIIHCVGSKSQKYNEYCSGVCCMYSAKLALLTKKKIPDIKITEFHSDICADGKGYQQFWNRLPSEKVNLIRVNDPEEIKINEKENHLNVNYKDIKSGLKKSISADIVVLSPAIEPGQNAKEIAKTFMIPQDKYGFFVEEHGKIAPVSTINNGIFIAGCAQGPKDIQGSITQGGAAAGKLLSSLIIGEKLELETIITEIDENTCGGCKICISLCPYKAISFDKVKNISIVSEVLCKGCGTCASACPSGAAKSRNFTLPQVFAEIEGVIS